MKFKKIAYAVVVASSLSLTGCGGGNPVQDNKPVPNPLPSTSSPYPVPPNIKNLGGVDYDVYQISQPHVQDVLNRNPNATGSGVNIGVVDTGVRMTHDEFGTKPGGTLSQTGFQYDPNTGTLIQVTDPNKLKDIGEGVNHKLVGTGHGTGVAAVTAGANVGLAPEANIMVSKVFWYDSDNDVYDAYDENIVEGITYLAGNGANVINASLGFLGYDGATFINQSDTCSVNGSAGSCYKVIADSLTTNNDVAFIAAAGNEFAHDLAKKAYVQRDAALNDPNGYSEFYSLILDPNIEKRVLIAIAGDRDGFVDIYGQYAFTNTPGDCTQTDFEGVPYTCTPEEDQYYYSHFITAPGVDVPTAIDNPSATNPDSQYTQMIGTSFASPVVAGAFAVIKSGWNYLSAEQVVSILKDSAFKDFPEYDPHIYGVGILDLKQALQPVGPLTTGSTTMSVYTVRDFKAKLPSWGAKISAKFEKVAMFDKYNRNFEVNLSKGMTVDNAPVNVAALPGKVGMAGQAGRFNQFGMTMGYVPTAGAGGFFAKSGNLTLGFGDGEISPLGFSGNTNPIVASMLSFTGDKFDQSMMMGWSTEYGMMFVNSGVMTGQFGSEKTVSLGFMKDFGKGKTAGTLTFGFETKAGNGIFGLEGDGGMRFDNASANLMSFSIVKGVNENNSVFAKLRYGMSDDLNTASEYVSISDMKVGQVVLGYAGQDVKQNASWGIQVYSDLKPVQGTMHYHIPVGITSTGQVVYNSGKEDISQGLTLDKVMFYYNKRF